MKKNSLIILFLLTIVNISVGQLIEFSDDFENGVFNWTLTGDWDVTSEQANGGSYSLTDSPNGNYSPNTDVVATLDQNIDLSSVVDALLQFDAIFDIETGFDNCYVEISGDGGASWIEVAALSGQDNLTPWKEYQYSLGGVVGSDSVKIRFKMSSDPGGELDGIYIDNFYITSFQQDISPPLILHSAPELYEGVAGPTTISAEIFDVSGLANIELNYSQDGGMNQTITGTNVMGDFWEFVLPTNEAGVQIDYSISATDASANSNFGTTSTFSFITGKHEFVDNGAIAFVQSFGPLAISGLSGSAVKYNLDDRRIAFALIRNYTDVNRPNNDIEVHLWGVDSSGMYPGTDLITPILISPEANLIETTLMTRVDLRAYQALWNITGDIFIGYTVPSGECWTTQTDPGIGESSYELDDNGWYYNQNIDYHYRIITGDAMMTNVEELIFDQSIEIFPNPTSGSALLKLDLERRSNLTIQISNQLGQVVDHFVEKNVGIGNIDLNTSNLTDGIYYISITNGEVFTTKKLVKQ